MEAFDTDIRISTQNALFQQFLPLFVSEAHGSIPSPRSLQSQLHYGMLFLAFPKLSLPFQLL
jgi:hypothetical protein